jgi:hypothetical protein
VCVSGRCGCSLCGVSFIAARFRWRIHSAYYRIQSKDHSARPAGVDAGDVFKLLALFLQLLSILGSLPVPWPSDLLAIISASDLVFGSSTGQAMAWAAAHFERVLKGVRIPSSVVKLLIYLCMPAFVTMIELRVFWTIYACCCLRQNRAALFPVVLLVSAFFTFPMWVRSVFSFFQCFGVADPTLPQPLWWVQDMAQACYH